MLNIYKASAGSGKTYQLAKEYIRALIGIKPAESKAYRLNLPKYTEGMGETSNRHRYILAITFTNKATEEMKKRIIDELDALSKPPVVIDGKVKDANYAEDLCKEFGCTRQEIAEVSAKALRQLLNDYNAFNVTTIDSFFQRVLRSFARELDRQGDFAVELDDTLAMQTSVGLMLDDYNRDPQRNEALGHWILTYMLRQVKNGGKSNFFNRKSHLFTQMVALVSRISEEKFKDIASDMQEYLADDTKINAFKDTLTDRMQQIVTEASATTKAYENALKDIGGGFDQFSGKFSSVTRLVNQLVSGVKPVTAKQLNTDSIDKIIDGRSTILPKKHQTPEKLNLLSEMFSQIKALYNEREILSDIYDSTEQLALLGYTWKYLRRFINDNNMILLSDTNHLLEQIIGKDDTPFIYEKLGVQLHSFLIDEFQDTSQMQWNNLKPLVGNGLLDGHDSLIIGDEKQSIYRFRNSDSSLLHSQVANVDFKNPIYGTTIHGDAPGQNTNYRSAADIVRFNNTLFKALAENLQLRGFENTVQEIAPKKAKVPGYIRFIPAPPKAKGDGKDPDNAVDDPNNVILSMLADNILSQHNDGKYAWSDIAILVKRNSEGATAIEYIIKNHPEIPILSDDSLFVRKSTAVQRVISILKILANDFAASTDQNAGIQKFPSAREVAVAINRFKYFIDHGYSAELAVECAIDPSKADDDTDISNCIQTIKVRKPSSLVSLIETIIHEMVPEHERKSQISYISAFMDHVIEFGKRNTPSVQAFLKSWEKAKNSLTVPAGANINAVRVMTIHKSKGLEFDCVHIPFGSWDERGAPRGQWIRLPHTEPFVTPETPKAVYLKFDNNYGLPGSYFVNEYNIDMYERLIDTMNLTYVAYTRAARELTVYYVPDKGIAVPLREAFIAACATDDPRLCDLNKHYDDSTKALTIGESTTKEDSDRDRSTEMMHIDGYNVYYHKNADVVTRVEDMLDPEPEQAPVLNRPATTKEEEEARQWGILLHDILSQVYDIDDIADATKRVSVNRRIPSDKSAYAQKTVTEMLNPDNEYIRRWFVEFDQVLTEQSILLPDDYTPPFERYDNREVDYRRPDRIVFNDGEVDIIDYKFATKVSKSHRMQMLEYVDILKKMGYSNVNGYLWYPLNHGIIKITDTRS